MSEPVCEICGKGLYKALRAGCSQRGCESVREDFEEARRWYSDPLESSERSLYGLSERFGVAFDGWRHWIVDSATQNWYQMDTHEKALARSRAWNYEYSEMLDGRDRYGRE